MALNKPCSEPKLFSTITGKELDLTTLTVNDIDFRDIISSLCSQPRFLGHTNCGYTIGVHNILMAGKTWKETSDPVLTLTALFHGSAAAYIGDIPESVKTLPELKEYRTLETNINTIVLTKLGVAEHIDNFFIKKVDNNITAIEKYLQKLSGLYTNPYDKTTPYLHEYFTDTELFNTIFETLLLDLAEKQLPPETSTEMNKIVAQLEKTLQDLIYQLKEVNFKNQARIESQKELI